MIIRSGPRQNRIVDAIFGAAGKMTITELVKACGRSKNHVRDALGVLWARGCIDWVGPETAQLTAKGRAIADARRASQLEVRQEIDASVRTRKKEIT